MEFKQRVSDNMKNGYEYYYLFGLDIPLEKYGLGRIKQPKIIDFLSKDIEIEEFYYPFVAKDILLAQSSNKDDMLKLRNFLGDLTFLIWVCRESGRTDILNTIKEYLEFIYNDEFYFTDNFIIKSRNI